MAIPILWSLTFPLLKFLEDGKPHSMRDANEHLANEFKLTDDDRKELLPSGKQGRFQNRVAWARAELKMAGLIDNAGTGQVVITEKGREVLSSKPQVLNRTYFLRFPEYTEKINKKKRDVGAKEVIETEEKSDNGQTPTEMMQNGYVAIRDALAIDLLDIVMKCSPIFFEKLVVELLVKMGYGGSIKDAGKAIGKSGDEGIDGTIKEDKLGLDIIYIQAKRWKSDSSVGRPEIQKFVGALAGQGAKKGIFITTSYFSDAALEYTPKNETKIVLIDGEQLAQLMIDYNLGVNLQQTFDVKRIDSDYFEEE